MIAFGRSPVSPTEASTTMIIGAIARIGTVWLAITQGITLALHRPVMHDPDRQQDPEPGAEHEPGQRRRQRHPGVVDEAPLRASARILDRRLPELRRHLVRRRQPRPLLGHRRRDERRRPQRRPRRAPAWSRAQAAFSTTASAYQSDEDPGDHRQHRQDRAAPAHDAPGQASRMSGSPSSLSPVGAPQLDEPLPRVERPRAPRWRRRSRASARPGSPPSRPPTSAAPTPRPRASGREVEPVDMPVREREKPDHRAVALGHRHRARRQHVLAEVPLDRPRADARAASRRSRRPRR